MKINLSDTASESFILSKESSSKTFHFTSIEFYLFISKASLFVELENSDWQQIISKLEKNYTYIIKLLRQLQLNEQKNFHFQYIYLSTPIILSPCLNLISL